MKTNYAEYTDSQVVSDLKARLKISQTELAKMFYLSQSRISEVMAGKNFLRPAVRQAMIDLLEADDAKFIVE